MSHVVVFFVVHSLLMHATVVLGLSPGVLLLFLRVLRLTVIGFFFFFCICVNIRCALYVVIMQWLKCLRFLNISFLTHNYL